MVSTIVRALYWAPRLLGILFAVFLSLFAADVFGAGEGFWSTAVALVMHLMPVFLVLLVLALSWRRELVGAIVFVLLGAMYLVLALGRMHWSAVAAIAGPLFVIGALFFSNWWFTRRAVPSKRGGATAQ